MRKIFGYIVVVTVFIVLVKFINWAYLLVTDNYDYAELGFLSFVIGLVFFGMFLGSLDFICEWKKEGCWKINKERLLALGLPLSIITLLVYAKYMGIGLPEVINSLMFKILLASNIYEYIAIFLGYIIISSFTKESKPMVSIDKFQANSGNMQSF